MPLPFTRNWTGSPDWPVSDLRMVKRLWDIYWEPQSDPNLENARLEVVRRWKWAIAAIFGGSLIPILASYL